MIEGKFYTIFPVLFGIGFSILHTRSQAKGLTFHRFFLRRAAVLCLIGIGHAVLFWHNDILVHYAICGALMLPFVHRRNTTVLSAALVALLTPTLLALFGGIPPGTFPGISSSSGSASRRPRASASGRKAGSST